MSYTDAKSIILESDDEVQLNKKEAFVMPVEGKTAVFLGAGASSADGAPRQSGLFEEYFLRCDPDSPENRRAMSILRERPGGERYRELYRELYRERRKRYDELERFFKDFFGLQVPATATSQCRFPTFEEVLGILEIAIEQNESFREWYNDELSATDGKRTIMYIHDQLILSIADLLKRLDSDVGVETYHRKLVRNLQTDGQLSCTDFISLNYDILLDNALIRQDITPDYHIEFDPPFILETGEHASILKLHGSLNWRYCPTCRSVLHTGTQKGTGGTHGKCRTPTIPIMIPPTYFKALSNLYLRQIWHAAEKVLVECQRLVFCGYSFPDTDVHVRYLLKRTELNRRADSAPPEIYIVNEHRAPPKDPHSRRGELERYHRFFRDKDRLHWVRNSFQDFAEVPDIVADPSHWQSYEDIRDMCEDSGMASPR